MPEEIEYHDEMIAMLEIIWGPGFMAPGGEGNIANLVIELRRNLWLNGQNTAAKDHDV